MGFGGIHASVGSSPESLKATLPGRDTNWVPDADSVALSYQQTFAEQLRCAHALPSRMDCISRKWPSGLMCAFMLISAPWLS